MCSIDKETLVENMNQILMEAICCGGDSGGAYNGSSKELTSFLQTWLTFNGLEKDYKVGLDKDLFFFTQIIPIDIPIYYEF